MKINAFEVVAIAAILTAGAAPAMPQTMSPPPAVNAKQAAAHAKAVAALLKAQLKAHAKAQAALAKALAKARARAGR